MGLKFKQRNVQKTRELARRKALLHMMAGKQKGARRVRKAGDHVARLNVPQLEKKQATEILNWSGGTTAREPGSVTARLDTAHCK
jgi:hypothetical protein